MSVKNLFGETAKKRQSVALNGNKRRYHRTVKGRKLNPFRLHSRCKEYEGFLCEVVLPSGTKPTSDLLKTNIYQKWIQRVLRI